MATTRRDRFPWEAYASGALAGLFAAVSAYWALGGTVGLRGVGGFAQRMAHTGGPTAAVVIWAAVAAKAGGAALSLSLVSGRKETTRAAGGRTSRRGRRKSVTAAQVVSARARVRPWGAPIPRRWRAGIGGAAALVLTLYGAANVVGAALVELGVVSPGGAVDWTALRWHLGLWDPWFVVWGLLLGAATWRFLRSGGMHRTVRPRNAGHGPTLSMTPGR